MTTNMLRNKLPRLALLMAFAASSVVINAQDSQAEFAAREYGDAQGIAAAKEVAPTEAVEMASADGATSVAAAVKAAAIDKAEALAPEAVSAAGVESAAAANPAAEGDAREAPAGAAYAIEDARAELAAISAQNTA